MEIDVQLRDLLSNFLPLIIHDRVYIPFALAGRLENDKDVSFIGLRGKQTKLCSCSSGPCENFRGLGYDCLHLLGKPIYVLKRGARRSEVIEHITAFINGWKKIRS